MQTPAKKKKKKKAAKRVTCGFCGRRGLPATMEGPDNDRFAIVKWRCVDACACCKRKGEWCGCSDHPRPKSDV